MSGAQRKMTISATQPVTCDGIRSCFLIISAGDASPSLQRSHILGRAICSTLRLKQKKRLANMGSLTIHMVCRSLTKAMHAMNRRCACLHIADPKQRCNLFDTLVLPILSYASEVWAVDEGLGEAAEQLHRYCFNPSMCLASETICFSSMCLASFICMNSDYLSNDHG